jgi:hypothetical protein
MQHLSVALDFPTKSEGPDCSVVHAVSVRTLGMAARAVHEAISDCRSRKCASDQILKIRSAFLPAICLA